VVEQTQLENKFNSKFMTQKLQSGLNSLQSKDSDMLAGVWTQIYFYMEGLTMKAQLFLQMPSLS